VQLVHKAEDVAGQADARWQARDLLRKEVEGVFVVKTGKATFVPVEVGIAGERYFEVLKGLSQGDRVITGPFDSVRNLFEADDVREAPPAAAR